MYRFTFLNLVIKIILLFYLKWQMKTKNPASQKIIEKLTIL